MTVKEEFELRKWAMGDKESLTRLCNTVDRRYLSDRLPSPYENSDAEKWLSFVHEEDGKNGLFRTVVVDNQIVGSISVELKDNYSEGEMGYMLLTDYWSHGIMTEAVAQMSLLAFELLGVNKISALVCKQNVASAKVLEKNGFQKCPMPSNATDERRENTFVKYELMSSAALSSIP